MQAHRALDTDRLAQLGNTKGGVQPAGELVDATLPASWTQRPTTAAPLAIKDLSIFG